jgi:hypothetical protein
MADCIGGGPLHLELRTHCTRFWHSSFIIGDIPRQAAPAIFGRGTITETATIRDSIVRLGLNYRFRPFNEGAWQSWREQPVQVRPR